MNRLVGTLNATLLGWLTIGGQLWAQPTPSAVPEIDATGILTGLAVLAGVLAVVAERQRQK
jgi:hypothetical protein